MLEKKNDLGRHDNRKIKYGHSDLLMSVDSGGEDLNQARVAYDLNCGPQGVS